MTGIASGQDAATEQSNLKATVLLYLLAPIDWIVLAILFGTELLTRMWRRIDSRSVPTFPPVRPECSFVLLSWNSQSMLAESLPALLQELRVDGGNHEVVVVDDHSTDGTDEYIRRRFPEVRLVQSKENLYFGAANRLGIAMATRDVLVLMNNDVIVHPGFLAPLLKGMQDPSVFGVSAMVSDREVERSETGNTHARFDGREIQWSHRTVCAGQSCTKPVFWLHRGLFAVDRRKYGWLGGLDDLYDPLYLEDVDLSYRAWKAGWSCVLATNSQISHHHRLGIPASGEGFLHTIVRRNQYMFYWKNINSMSMLAAHLLYASGRRLRRARIPGIGIAREVHSFLAALKRLPAILGRRVVLARQVARTDEDVFCLTDVAEPDCPKLPAGRS